MFANKCLGGLKYEATTAAIVMAGVMISFVPEYVGARIFLWRVSKQAQDAPASPVPDQGPDSKVAGSSEAAVGHHMQGVDGQAQAQSPALQKLKVNIMEAGIIFHSLRKWPINQISHTLADDKQ
jgi:zinc transporter 1/2/3